ncbi:MAG TPA: hypothetical protein VKA49_21920 [Flavitalea sp.]|nr:hypothetical protein [Flavitalea sp.]
MKITLFYTAIILLTVTSCRKELPLEPKVTFDRDAFHHRAMGSSASELLSDRTYKALDVEIQYVAGFKPQDLTLSHLGSFLETYLNKPGGINIFLKEIPATDRDALSMDEVSAIEKEKRARFVDQDTTAIYILFTNGVHPGNKILGMAYRNTSAVIYGKAIRKYSSMAGRLTHHELETAVLLHEIGHLLGLVNKGSALTSEHNDSAFHDHCNNKNCLMFHSVETKSLSSILLKGNIPVLDASCIEDLVANGGKNVPDYRPFVKPFTPVY